MRTLTLALCLASLVAHGATEDFREFHIPAKQSVQTGQMLWSGLWFFQTPGSLWLNGQTPPLIHERSLQSSDGAWLSVSVAFDAPFAVLSFDVRATNAKQTGLWVWGRDIYDFYPAQQDEWTHIEITMTPPFSLVLVGFGPTRTGFSGSPCITNITIE